MLSAALLSIVIAVTSDDRPPELVAKLIQETCVDCHRGASAEAELDLQRLPWTTDSASGLQPWIHVYDRIASGEMPPDAERLPGRQRVAVLKALSDALHLGDHALVRKSGRGPLRRLNQREYEDTLRDLLGMPHLDVRDILPEDRVTHHSNKSASTLDMTRVQLAAYLDAADAALRQAVASGVTRRPQQSYHALATKMFPKAIDHAGRESTFYAKHSRMIPLTTGDLKRIRETDAHDPEVEVAIFRSATWPYYGYPEEFLAKETGVYSVRFAARAVRQLRDFRLVPSSAPQPMTFRARQPSKADVSGDVRGVGGTIDVRPEPATYETSVRLKAGETIEYSLLGLPVPFPITSHGGPLYYDFPPMPAGGHPGIAFRWIEIAGPVESEVWPPPSHQVLFDDLPLRPAQTSDSWLRIDVVSQSPRVDAWRLLKRFATAAAHRPVPESALREYEQLIHQQLDEGRSFAAAMIAGYKAFLCSGHFLYVRNPENSKDLFARASRLAFLLWNSRPDDRLRKLAQSGELDKPAVLHREIDRLIADRRFERFIENFTDYWLDLRHLNRDAPDIRLYPEYRGDDYLVESMGQETRAFITSLIRENLSVKALVDSDFAMVNDRLAQHYELPAVSGSAMRRVSLPNGSSRGGLLTQAAISKVTANGTTTSPVIRGAWVMDRVLGQPPPPPPPDVATIEPDLRGSTTIRDILDRHASDESCATCHRRFDPVGLALENFDILGGWRERYRSLEKGDEITGIDRAGHKYSYRVAEAVDSTGQLMDGQSFRDVHELKAILVTDARQLARNLLRRLTVYATGTPIRFSDRREIEAILDHCEPAGFRLGDLLHGLLTNRIFVGEEPRHPLTTDRTS